MSKTERFVFRLTPTDRQAIEQLAAVKKVKPSEAIRQAVKMALQSNQPQAASQGNQ